MPPKHPRQPPENQRGYLRDTLRSQSVLAEPCYCVTGSGDSASKPSSAIAAWRARRRSCLRGPASRASPARSLPPRSRRICAGVRDSRCGRSRRCRAYAAARPTTARLIGHRLHVIARSDDRAGLAFKQLGDMRHPRHLRRMQAVPAIHRQSFAAQFVVAGHGPYIGRHLVALRQNLLRLQCFIQNRAAAEQLRDRTDRSPPRGTCRCPSEFPRAIRRHAISMPGIGGCA